MKTETKTPLRRPDQWASSNKSKATSLLAGLALASSLFVQPASAAVTPQGWWRYGELPDYYGDASGNNRRFGQAFSCAGGGNAGAGVTPFGVGGPLGTTGIISTNCLYWTPLNCGNAGMWNPGSANAGDPVYDGIAVYNPPATNYVIECWILPDPAPGTGKFFMSGSTDFSQPSRASGAGPGGVYFYRDASTMQVGAFVIANAAQGVPANTQIGDYANIDPDRWMHVAVVNNNGTNTFYVNGVANGAPQPLNTIPNGNIFAGCGEGTGGAFHGYLDELRISTFAAGAFSISDLLLRPPGPSIVAQPQSATVWNGGSAPFTVLAAIDSSITYQWQQLGTVFTNLPSQNAATLYLPQVSLADSGAQFQCVLTASSASVTSSIVTLTVLPNRTADVDFYRAAVTGEAGIAAYFPVDGCLNTTLSNIVDVLHDGQFEGNVTYDGRTNRAFGQRAVSFSGAGDVQIPNKPAFEFSGGNGTIEALIYLERGSLQDGTIFAWAADGSTIGYALQANKDGSSIIYTNDSPVTLSWPVPQNLIGRLAHVALVIDNLTNVTVVLDGQSLGTKTQPGLGAANGSPAWIGALGTSLVKPFAGTIDELSIYGTNLSLNTIQVHYSRYLYGTNVSAPSIVSQPANRSVIAGTAPLLKVQVAGTLPISYQWKSNDVAIPGATASTFKVVSGPGSVAANYVLYATNAIGWTNSQPIAITFLAPPSPYSTAVATDHPIAYWRLDEASGTTTIDSAGYHDATYSGAVTFGAPAVVGTESDPAVNFAGTGRATLGNSPDLNPAGPFTLEVWTRPNPGGSDQGGIILASQNRSNSRGGYSLHADFFANEYGIDLGAPNASVTRYISSTVPQDGVPVHIVFTWDGVGPQGAFYVNGQKTTTPAGGFAGNMLNFVNNTVQPLTMGIRYDGSGPWNGVVDEVAFYDYALSDARVTNHWSFSWVPAGIGQGPTATNTVEGNTFTLTALVTGYPNTYQWFKGSVALDATTLNPDGSLKYPQGVTSTTLVITQSNPSDAAQYHLAIINPLGNIQSSDANVGVALDTTKPTVLSVTGLGNGGATASNLVKVVFSKRIDPTTGGNTANYSIPGTTVSSVTLESDPRAAALGADWREAILVTTGLTPGQAYNLTVGAAVKDQTVTGNTILPVAVQFRAPVLTQGILYWDYYYLGSLPDCPDCVNSLINSPIYPNAPMTNATLTSFDTTPLTGGNLAGNPTFGSLGENYGDSVSGWIKPTVTTNYYFFLASDDHSRLMLNSTGGDPAGAGQIANLDGARGNFVEPGVDTSVSELIPLTAGVSYFIQTLHVEGGGGDYVKVAWRMEGDTTPAANLLPIPSAYLSAYAPLAVPKFNPIVVSGGQLTITWTGTGTLYESTDFTAWTPVPGNPGSGYTVTPVGSAKFYRLVQ